MKDIAVGYAVGSPPQVRGKLAAFLNSLPVIRITPAGAGKTPALTGFIGAGWDHPRRCGENGISVPSVKTITGSPPQVRGKHTVMDRRADEDRITPAGAGKTTIAYGAARVHRDHPRRCGENHSLP